MLKKFIPVSERRRYMTAPIQDYLHALRYQQEYEFHCFVRNPYKRLVSAWNDKLVRDFKIGKYSKRFVKLIPKIRKFALASNLPGSDTSSYIPFATLIAYIESETEGNRNQHWDTQHSVLQMSKVNFTHIHRMESEFAENVAKIMHKVGIPENWTLEKMQRPSNASGEAPESVYNQELADRVYAIYQDDFERFGYNRESWKEC